MGAEDLDGGSKGGLKFCAGLNFSTEIFRTFLKNNFEMYLIPFKIALQCILNTYIYFLVIGRSKILHNFRREV